MNKTSGTVIYDNQMGAMDTTAATTVIGGGSIVIQTSSSNKTAAASSQGAMDTPMLTGAPLAFALAQNAPNPFHGSTEIGFSLPEKSRVKLTVYDLAGREVASLADGAWEPGLHVVKWSGRGNGASLVRGGVYFVRMVAESVTGTQRYTSLRKMIRIE